MLPGMVSATGFAVTWHGIDGWLFFLAAICFVLACLAAAGKGGRFVSNALLFGFLGLLLWVLTNLVSGG